MASFAQMMGILDQGTKNLSGAFGAIADRKRQAALDEQNKKVQDAQLGLTSLQAEKEKYGFDKLKTTDESTKNLAAEAMATIDEKINAFSQTATPEDKKYIDQLKQAKMFLRANPNLNPEQIQNLMSIDPMELKKADTNKDKQTKLSFEKTESDIGETKARTGFLGEQALTEKKQRGLLGQPKPEDKEAGFNQETKLRNEFVQQTKDFATVKDAYKKIEAVSKKPSAANDISLVYGFMKLNDPGSTVREGEFATAQNAGSIPERVRAMYNKALSGERLAENVRNDFVSSAKTLYDSQLGTYQNTKKNYANLSKQYGLDPSRVTMNIEGDTKTNQLEQLWNSQPSQPTAGKMKFK